MEDVKQTETMEEKVEEKPTTNEEKATKTYTEEEVKQLLAETKKNAIAEGMRKASKNQEASNNEELEKLNASLSEKDNLLAEKETQALQHELSRHFRLSRHICRARGEPDARSAMLFPWATARPTWRNSRRSG